MNFKRRNKSFTKKRSREMFLDSWSHRLYKGDIIHEFVKKESNIKEKT